MSTFDFHDGEGPVPAHRHKNPNGSLGGWVAETAFVAPTAHVGYWSWVFGLAMVDGEATINNVARVSGRALVGDNAVICGSAHIMDDSCVSRHGYVGGSSVISGRSLVFGAVSSHNVWDADVPCAQFIEALTWGVR